MLRRSWVLAGVLLLACGGDDSFNPTPETMAGTYQLTTLKETQNGITLDHLALGVTAELFLRPMAPPPDTSSLPTARRTEAISTPI